MKKSKKWKRLISMLTICVFTSFMALPSSAASSTDWTANAPQLSLFKKTSTSEFEVLGSGSQPVAAFSYDAANTTTKTDISTTDISFKLTIAEAGEGHNDFYALFALRMKDPSVGSWGPGNACITLQFNSSKIELRRWSNGAFDEANLQTLELDTIDGKEHDVNIKITDKTVTATVDGQSISATYTVLPSSGGYQFMAYKSHVKISGFDDGAQGQVTPPTQAPDATGTPTEAPESSSAQTTIGSTSSAGSSVSSKTEASSAATSAPGADSGSGSLVWIFVTVVVVLLCVGGGLAYYFLVYKKK